MMALAKSVNVETHTLNGVWKTNLNLPGERDWETMTGRAIIEDK